MREMDDMALLREYRARQSETAFTTLVERHIGLVYCAALRQVRDPALAQEITQVVFILLAKKARSLREGTILSAWLYRAARFAASDARKMAFRRQQREHEAAQMQTIAPSSSDESAWEHIAPLLDEAMAALGENDRNAVMLRFFEQKSLEEVGAALGIDTGAAQKRVWRAVDKLRQYFARHGAAFSAATITAALSAHALHAVPSGLAAAVAATATLKGTAATVSTATLLKTTLKLMAWTKAKLAATAVVGILLATATTTITVKEIQEHRTYSWQAGGFDSRVLAKRAPQVAILPSKGSGGAGMSGGKLMGKTTSAQGVIEAAYGVWSGGPVATIVLTELPKGSYDYIASLPSGNAVALQEEVKRKFGVIGRFETRQTNVLALTVKKANAPGLRPDTSPRGPGGGRSKAGEYSCFNSPLLSLANFLTDYFNTNVTNHTGFTGRFDIDLKWDETDRWAPQSRCLKAGPAGPTRLGTCAHQ